MKKILIFALGLFVFASCANKSAENKCNLKHTKWAYDATIYELNTRQLTEEGTFAAAEAILPQLKESGIDIIWIMPCQKIGVLNRKGTLGSYYAIQDYCELNPE
ncbi:MAG: alpha-amylase, partial [Paludibacteraceae bacterium]|nr:alpha-amylase [Paludibacteraceae bacterium]